MSLLLTGTLSKQYSYHLLLILIAICTATSYYHIATVHTVIFLAPIYKALPQEHSTSYSSHDYYGQSHVYEVM